MSKRAPDRFARRPGDFYATPRAAVLPLIPHLKAARIKSFAEPCCGDFTLVRHLEGFGLTCTLASDIATGQDALAIPRFVAPIITNPPYSRPSMHALIRHFPTAAPYSWLLLEADWIWTKQARPFLPHSTEIVPIGRLKWIEGSPFHQPRQLRLGPAGPRPSCRPDRSARYEPVDGAHDHVRGLRPIIPADAERCSVL